MRKSTVGLPRAKSEGQKAEGRKPVSRCQRGTGNRAPLRCEEVWHPSWVLSVVRLDRFARQRVPVGNRKAPDKGPTQQVGFADASKPVACEVSSIERSSVGIVAVFICHRSLSGPLLTA